MNINPKHIIFKLLIITCVLVISNYIYKKYYFEKDIQAHSDIINLVRDAVKDSSEIIYIGESSNVTSRGDDLDKRPISGFIAAYYPTLKVGNITKPASHAGIYYELLRNIPESSRVKTIIVTLNLRSFDANWIYSDLETPLQKSIVLLKDNPPLLNRFLLSFKGYDIKNKDEREAQYKRRWRNDKLKFPNEFKYDNVIDWDRGMAREGIKNPDGSINYPLTELACHYIKTYAFQIDTTSNPRIKDFDKIVELAQERNWKLVFNLMAENTEKAKELVGDELVYLIRQNRDLLVERYTRKGATVVDNLEKVHDAEYIDRAWTTEHYAEMGRRIVAENIAEALKKFYPKQYVKVKKEERPVEFFNDCEGGTIWGQMQSLTNENHFSGEKSCKTGQSQEYSITFEYSIRNIPDTITKIAVEFQVFQKELNKDAVLVFESSGKFIQPRWDNNYIKDYAKEINKWQQVKINYPLYDNFMSGDMIKIYVHNPSNSLLYIDDFKIAFQ